MGGLGLIFLVAALALGIAAGAVYQFVDARKEAKRLPPPGRIVDGLHLDIEGEGNPPVVFEAGIAATSLSWRLVQPEIARERQTVSYDRAGLGWSSPCSSPRLIWTLVDELRRALAAAKVPAPRILVGHSFGGMIALAYAARFPNEVSGLVLVDPVGLEEWANPSDAHSRNRLRGMFLARLGQFLATVGVVRFALALVAAGSHRVPKMIARASSGRRGAAFTERMAGEIRKLPREVWPAVQSHWCNPQSFYAMRKYLEALPENARLVLEAARGLDVSLVVLSAGNSSPAQRADHERVARLSPRGRMEIVEGSGHWIMLDRPDLVIAAIHSVFKITAA
jgi:pimeloyl-ACP methyl ester carboxylesterase